MKLTIKTQNREVVTVKEVPWGHMFKSVAHDGVGIKGHEGSATWILNSEGRVAAYHIVDQTLARVIDLGPVEVEVQE